MTQRNAMLDNPKKPPSPKEKAWTVVRMLLGLAQIIAATVSVYLLVQTGVNELSLSAVAITCACTTVSVLLFGKRKD